MKRNIRSEETHPKPLQGGDASAQPLLFEDAYENENSFMQPEKKLDAV
jgi:hypothetical protein